MSRGRRLCPGTLNHDGRRCIANAYSSPDSTSTLLLAARFRCTRQSGARGWNASRGSDQRIAKRRRRALRGSDAIEKAQPRHVEEISQAENTTDVGRAVVHSHAPAHVNRVPLRHVEHRPGEGRNENEPRGRRPMGDERGRRYGCIELRLDARRRVRRLPAWAVAPCAPARSCSPCRPALPGAVR